MSSAESRLSLLDSVIRSAKICVTVNLVVRGTERKVVSCVCSIRFIIERTTA